MLASPAVRLALMIEGQEGVTWDDWVAIADACEEHGVEALFRSDHYVSGFDETRHVLDAWTTVAGLAARTTKLQLGTLVSPATFRHPSVLAHAAATADEISGGRVTLGLGAGWMQREHEAYGFDFATARVRVARFGEQLEIVHRLFSAAHPASSGRTSPSSSAEASSRERPNRPCASRTSTTPSSRRPMRSVRASGRSTRRASVPDATRQRCATR